MTLGASDDTGTDWRELARLLAAELRPYPGRAATVGRMLTACTLTMLLAMNLKLQFAFLGVFNALIISRETPGWLLKNGPLVILANIAALLYVVAGLNLFSSYPVAYVAFLLLSFCLVFFVKSVTSDDNLAFGFGVIVVVTSTFLWYRHGSLGQRLDAMISLCSAVILGTLIAMAVAWAALWIAGDVTAPEAPGGLRGLALRGPGQRGVFAADAFSNPAHLRFALKGCLAGSLCLALDSAVAWPMIMGACAMTCTVTGAPATIRAAPRQRLHVRLAALFIGGVVLGMGSQALVLPALDSITGFTVQFVLFSALAAWLATCSPRLSYAGTLVAMAYLFTMLERFGPSESLARSRDVMIDIAVGVVLIWLIVEREWTVRPPRAASPAGERPPA